MTTMQEALADKYLSAAEIPTFLAETNDLMQRSFQNPKYGNEGQSLNPNTAGAIPSKRQNKIRSGRAARKAANGRKDLQAVGGLSYRGPWDALKASSKPSDYLMCRLESEVKARVAGTPNTSHANTAHSNTPNTRTGTTRTANPNVGHRSSLLAAVIAQHKAAQAQS